MSNGPETSTASEARSGTWLRLSVPVQLPPRLLKAFPAT